MKQTCGSVFYGLFGVKISYNSGLFSLHLNKTMFATVEKYSGPAKVLLGLIALTFIGFGVSTVAAPGSDYIVKVG